MSLRARIEALERGQTGDPVYLTLGLSDHASERFAWCDELHLVRVPEENPKQFIARIVGIARRQGTAQATVLIPRTDHAMRYAAEHADLGDNSTFCLLDPDPDV